MSQKGFAHLILLLLLTGGVVATFFFTQKNNNPLIQKFSSFCQISAKELCDQKQVKLSGLVKDSASFTPQLGFKFIPEGDKLIQEIYISSPEYSGTRINGGPETFYFNLPFGRNITIIGTAKVKYPEGIIQVLPSSIIAKETNTNYYNVVGHIQNFQEVKNSCPQSASLCEENNPQNCYQIKLDQNLCSQMKKLGGEWLEDYYFISGYTHSLKDPLESGDIYQIASVGYANGYPNPTKGRFSDKYLAEGKTGKFAMYNEKGEKVSSIDLTSLTNETLEVADIENIIPAPNANYFLIKDKLYAQKKGDTKITLVGQLDENYTGDSQAIYNIKVSPNGNQIVFLTSKQISNRQVGNYGLSTKKINILKLNLSDLSAIEQKITPEVIYTETLEGFLSFESFDFSSNSAILSYSLDAENHDACRKKYYAKFSPNKGKEELFSYITEGNVYCQEAVYRQLYVSPDGKYLAFGRDFSQTTPLPHPMTLVVYQDIDNKFSKKEYVSDETTMNMPITSIKSGSLRVLDRYSPEIFFEFNLTKSEYKSKELKPTVPIASPSPSSYPKMPLAGLNKVLFVHEDLAKWYFYNLDDPLEFKFYAVDKKTQDITLIATFSVFSNDIIINKELFIVDIDH